MIVLRLLYGAMARILTSKISVIKQTVNGRWEYMFIKALKYSSVSAVTCIHVLS